MSKRRMDSLLTKAADAMEQGCDPFHVSFLSEHEVTLDEAYDMSDAIALAVRCFLAAKKKPGLFVALMALKEGDDDLGMAALHGWLMTENTRQMKALRSTQ